MASTTMLKKSPSKPVIVTRHANDLKEAKALQAAIQALGGTPTLRACGTWVNEENAPVEIKDVAYPIREIKSVWVDACVQGEWMRLRQVFEPGMPPETLPKIEVEAVFRDE